MYLARHKILGLDGEPIKAEIPETYKLQAVSAQFLNSLGMFRAFANSASFFLVLSFFLTAVLRARLLHF
jgi:hypothetical protein